MNLFSKDHPKEWQAKANEALATLQDALALIRKLAAQLAAANATIARLSAPVSDEEMNRFGEESAGCNSPEKGLTAKQFNALIAARLKENDGKQP